MRTAPVRDFLRAVTVVAIALMPARSFASTITIFTGPGGAVASQQLSFDPITNTLTVTLTNTSPFDTHLTGFGFDLYADDFTSNGSTGLNGFSGADVSSFIFTDGALGNVPQFNDVVLDFGWLTGGNFAGGSPGSGIAPGNSLTFTASGVAFAGLSEAGIAEDVFVRFQSVPAPSPVPEPATMVLLGTGLFGAVAAARRRHRRD